MASSSASAKHVASDSRPAPPEPSFAERARTLIHLGRIGTLSTVSHRHPGHPFGSITPYGLDAAGGPTVLISTLAMHTQNLAADPRASLLVMQPGWTEDALAGARVTLLGQVTPVASSEVAAVRDDYLTRHESARCWVDFGDFSFYRMVVADVYFVAGFGVMGWVSAEAYCQAKPDPLAESAGAIIEHMNTDHSDALQLYCQVFAGVEHVEEATMTAVDRLGFRIRARVGDQLHGLRINFPREAHTADAVREILVRMVGDARARLAGQG